MCGRFVRVPSVGEILQSLEIQNFASSVKPSYNVAPTHRVLAIRGTPDGPAGFEPKWGFDVPWKSERASLVINARIESVHERPLFRDLVSTRRCLVPLTGYYEWASESSLLSSLGNPKGKIPYYITNRFNSDDPSRTLIAAGLWRHSHDADHVVLLTRAASDQVGYIHDRMPVLLDAAMRVEWMREGECDLRAFDDEPNISLAARRVSSAVNSARNDRSDLLLPFDGDDQPSLF